MPCDLNAAHDGPCGPDCRLHELPTPEPAPKPPPSPFACYAAIYLRLVSLARSLGYALAVHGSGSRDLDLIACPWTEAAVPAPQLAEAIREEVGGFFGWSMKGREFTLAGCPGGKPHGRLGWIIYLGDKPHIDLAVMPRGVDLEPGRS